MDRLTNKAMVASLVFSTIETAEFEQAERIGFEVCVAMGLDPDAQWNGYEKVE
jgi:predicted metal-dependent TIM-barrel fold hydrolase